MYSENKKKQKIVKQASNDVCMYTECVHTHEHIECVHTHEHMRAPRKQHKSSY
jgi:hypothetical protein